MQKPRAEIFTANAEKLEARSRLASDKDHPKWLRESLSNCGSRPLRKRELLSTGKNNESGSVSDTNKAAAPNRRPRFAFATLPGFVYSFCARPSSSAADGEPQRSAQK